MVWRVPRAIHFYTPCFPLRHRFSPPDLVFSTARVYQIPGPRNPGPGPRVFQCMLLLVISNF